MSINRTEIETIRGLAENMACMARAFNKWADRKEAGVFEPDAPAEPTPDRTGTWWVWHERSQDWIHIIGKPTNDRHTIDESRGGKYVRESDLPKYWLPIPPRPAVPAGQRLTGEVRVPAFGESYVSLSGAIATFTDGSRQPAIFDAKFSGRRWIVEDAPAEPLDDPGNAHCPPPSMPVAEQPASSAKRYMSPEELQSQADALDTGEVPAASEAVKYEWTLDPMGEKLCAILRRHGEAVVYLYAAATRDERNGVLRAFDPAFVSVRRELVEAWEEGEVVLRSYIENYPTTIWKNNIMTILAALDNARKSCESPKL